MNRERHTTPSALNNVWNIARATTGFDSQASDLAAEISHGSARITMTAVITLNSRCPIINCFLALLCHELDTNHINAVEKALQTLDPIIIPTATSKEISCTCSAARVTTDTAAVVCMTVAITIPISTATPIHIPLNIFTSSCVVAISTASLRKCSHRNISPNPKISFRNAYALLYSLQHIIPIAHAPTR